jgi:hypothetical protein
MTKRIDIKLKRLSGVTSGPPPRNSSLASFGVAASETSIATASTTERSFPC